MASTVRSEQAAEIGGDHMRRAGREALRLRSPPPCEAAAGSTSKATAAHRGAWKIIAQKHQKIIEGASKERRRVALKVLRPLPASKAPAPKPEPKPKPKPKRVKSEPTGPTLCEQVQAREIDALTNELKREREAVFLLNELKREREAHRKTALKVHDLERQLMEGASMTFGAGWGNSGAGPGSFGTAGFDDPMASSQAFGSSFHPGHASFGATGFGATGAFKSAPAGPGFGQTLSGAAVGGCVGGCGCGALSSGFNPGTSAGFPSSTAGFCGSISSLGSLSSGTSTGLDSGPGSYGSFGGDVGTSETPRDA